MRVLDELYYGNIDPHTWPFSSSKALDNLRQTRIQNESKMRAMLSEEQKDWYERCMALEGEVSVLQEREMFASGFCLAVRIMAEVMGTIEFPSVDD